jgi:hypothetical protein
MSVYLAFSRLYDYFVSLDNYRLGSRIMKPSDLFLSAVQFALTSVLASLTTDPDRSVEELKLEREAAAAMLAELCPRSAVQASYASRVVIMFHAAMESFRRAAAPGISPSMRARHIGQANALARQSTQMEKLLLTAKRASESAAPGAGMEAMLLRAGEVVMQRNAAQTQAAQAQAAAAPAAPAPAASNERKNPIHQEKSPAATPRAVTAIQYPMHQSAAYPLRHETAGATAAYDPKLAAYRASIAELGQSAAD